MPAPLPPYSAPAWPDRKPPPSRGRRGRKRANHHRVANPFRHLERLVGRTSDSVFRLLEAQFFDQSRKALAVFSAVNRVRGGAENLQARLLERNRKLQWGLTPELDDRSHRLFALGHLQDVLDRQWLEIEAIGSVVVGGNGLRVAVDHHRFVACPTQRKRGMDAAVVELDSLADANRTAPENQHLVPVGYARFVFFLVGGIE